MLYAHGLLPTNTRAGSPFRFNVFVLTLIRPDRGETSTDVLRTPRGFSSTRTLCASIVAKNAIHDRVDCPDNFGLIFSG